MRVFLAGGTGVVGRPLITQLVRTGHEVVATTRRPDRVRLLESLGAQGVVLDALDRDAVREQVTAARPAAIVHQLTALPSRYEPAKRAYYAETNRLRSAGTAHLLEAGSRVGVKRFVFQSVCFLYRLQGPMVLSEDAPVASDAPEPFGEAVRRTLEGERLVRGADGIAGVVLRYGQLYGPGTYFGREGDFARRARRRMLPMVAGGHGVFSFLHVEDAASAAVAALERGQGVYNVADDDPAPAREWMPAFCAALAAPRPFNIPVWMARLLVGSYPAHTLANFRGASNRKIKAELGWEPAHPSWRSGFLQVLRGDGSPQA